MMIPWTWTVLAFFLGVGFGIFMIALAEAGKDRDK